MNQLIVVNNPDNWPLQVAGVEVVSSRRYLSAPEYGESRRANVFNLCRSYSYQSIGYYVSLLAEARGHRPMPSVHTIQELRNVAAVRLLSQDLEQQVARSLRGLTSDEFVLSVYFGRNVAQKYERLSLALFNLLPAPLLRVVFERRRNGDDSWEIRSVRPIPLSEVPDAHRPFLLEATTSYLSKRERAPKKRRVHRYDLAVLIDPESPHPPSNERALSRFSKAADKLGVRAESVSKDDYGRIGEFDALFIRETTAVAHYTYRFALRAQAAGLMVIDDPESIVRCTNKVFLAEALRRRRIPCPRSVIVHDRNRDSVPEQLQFPIILKKPDSAFSQGVFKVSDREEYETVVQKILSESELVIAQEFVPSEFDWRIGVLGSRPLYACRYYMAHKHWQIVQRHGQQERYGEVEAVPIAKVPRAVLRNALRATRLMGDGLYGVDLKQTSRGALVIEVNDNPNIDGGEEDVVLGEALYERLVRFFVDGIEKLRRVR